MSDVEITHPPLSDVQLALLDSGPHRLYATHNVAPATYGGNVHYLERLGLLQISERHIDPDPSASYWVYARTDQPYSPAP